MCVCVYMINYVRYIIPRKLVPHIQQKPLIFLFFYDYKVTIYFSALRY